MWWGSHAASLLPESNFSAQEAGLSARLTSTWMYDNDDTEATVRALFDRLDTDNSVRVDIIGHARTKYVGKSQSCMVINLHIAQGYLEAAEITEMVRLLGLTPTEEELRVCVAEMERGGGASPSSADGS